MDGEGRPCLLWVSNYLLILNTANIYLCLFHQLLHQPIAYGMPSTRASKSTTRSGLPRQASPPASTASSARKRATSSVIDNNQVKRTKVNDEPAENKADKKKKDRKKEK